MHYRPFPFKGLIIFMTSVLIIAIITMAQNEPQDGHEFMKDINRCIECHIGEPVFGETDYRDLRFTDDIVSICHRCHSEESLGRSHPVNVRPQDDMEVPEDMHLDEYLNMTCATCHRPHADPYTKLKPTDYDSPIKKDRERYYRSYYLRRTNTKNALCYACHKR